MLGWGRMELLFVIFSYCLGGPGCDTSRSDWQLAKGEGYTAPPVHGSGEPWAPAVIFRTSEPGGGVVANKRSEMRSSSLEGSVACYGHGRLARTMPAAKGRRDKKVMYIIRNMVFGPLRR